MKEIEKDLRNNNNAADRKKQAFNEGNTDNTNQLTDGVASKNNRTNKTQADRKTEPTGRK